MTHAVASSLLIQEMLTHSPVSQGNAFVLCPNADQFVEIFSIGTDGKIYDIRPDRHSASGYSQVALPPLEAGFAATVIAAALDGEKRTVVCAGDGKKKAVATTRRGADGAWEAWRMIPPEAGADAGSMEFYDLQVRRAPSGDMEFLLLYLQRINTPAMPYTYRVGRADLAGSDWRIGFMLKEQFEGFIPKTPPSMFVGPWDGGPDALYLYVQESQRLEVWTDLDGDPAHQSIALGLQTNDRFAKMIGVEGAGAFFIFAAGDILPVGQDGGFGPGLYRLRLTGDQPAYDRIAAAALQSVTGTCDPGGPIDLMALGPDGELYHTRTRDQGASWDPLTQIAANTTGVTSIEAEAVGQMAVAVTNRGELFQYLRDPDASDWDVNPIELGTLNPEWVSSYKTSIVVVDDQDISAGGILVKLWSPFTTPISVDGRTHIIGPDHKITVPTGPGGRIALRQSIRSLRNLAVPELRVQPAGGEEQSVYPPHLVDERLYDLTPQELLEASGKNGYVLPGPSRNLETATALAQSVSATMSIGRPARYPASTAGAWRFSEGIPDGKAIFWPGRFASLRAAADALAGSAAPYRGGVLDWCDDQWEAVKEGVLEILEVAVEAVVDAATDLVKEVKVVIRTAEGIFETVVTSIAQGFDVVRALFEQAEAAFQDVLDWLTYFFDWENILAARDRIKGVITDAMSRVAAMIASSGIVEDPDAFVLPVRARIGEAMAWVRERTGAETLAQMQAGSSYQSLDELYRACGGEQAVIAANWLLDEVLERLDLVEIEVPESTDPAWAMLEGVFGAIKTGLDTTLRPMIDALQQFMVALQSPEQWKETLFGAFLDILEDFAYTAVDFIQGILSAGAAALLALLSGGGLLDVLRRTTIRIPVVNEILGLIGIPAIEIPSLFDLLALLVAIPVEIVKAFAETASAPRDAANDANLVMGIAASLGAVFSGLGHMLTGEVVPRIVGGIGTFCTLLYWSVWASTCGTETASDKISIFSVTWYGIYVATDVVAMWPTKLDEIQKYMPLYGVVMFEWMEILSGVYELIYCQVENQELHVTQFLGNHLGYLPDGARVFDLTKKEDKDKPLPVRAVQACVDVIGFGAMAASGFYAYAHPDELEVS